MSLHLGRWLKSEEFVHHKDGNKKNNTIENLELTNNSQHISMHNPALPEKQCKYCYKIFAPERSTTIYCSDACARRSKRKFNITKEELTVLVWQMSTVKVAKQLGVTDKAIEKRCKILGVVKPPVGYWAKQYARQCAPVVQKIE